MKTEDPMKSLLPGKPADTPKTLEINANVVKEELDNEAEEIAKSKKDSHALCPAGIDYGPLKQALLTLLTKVNQGNGHLLFPGFDNRTKLEPSIPTKEFDANAVYGVLPEPQLPTAPPKGKYR